MNHRERQQIGDKGSDVAAGTGLLAKGLIDDSSVVWGRYYSQ